MIGQLWLRMFQCSRFKTIPKCNRRTDRLL